MTKPAAKRGTKGATGAGSLPFLIATLSVTILAAQNADRGIGPLDLPLIFGFALLVAGTCWVAAGLGTKQSPYRGILAAFLVGVLLFGGRITDALTATGVDYRLALGLLLVVSGVAWVILVHRKPPIPVRAVRILAIAAATLILLNVVAMRPMFWETPAMSPPEPIISTSIQEQQARPNIYFIVLDAYSGPTSLKEIYGLDIEDFITSLEDMGFVVPRSSRANYTATFLALGSMLGMDYLDSLLGPLDPSSSDRGRVYNLLHDNATTRLLREKGYRIVFHRSAYPPLNSSTTADVHLPAFGIGEFQVAWVLQTSGPRIYRAVCDLLSCEPDAGLPFSPDGPGALLSKFEALGSGEGADTGPVFHYAHFLLPHEPLQFHADCTPREARYWGIDDSEVSPIEVHSMYVDQVLCANRLALQTVRDILRREVPAPVIIMQSDHGYARFPTGRPPALDEVSQDQVDERMDVFAAYHVPGLGTDLTYDGVTPVNAIRAIFSDVFELDLAPLPDHSYWSSFDRPYDFTRLP